SLVEAQRGAAGETEPGNIRIVLIAGGADRHWLRVRRSRVGATSGAKRAGSSDRSPGLAPGHAWRSHRCEAAWTGRGPETGADPLIRTGPRVWHRGTPPKDGRTRAGGPVPGPGMGTR